MLSRAGLAAFALVVACSSGCDNENVAACQAYVEAFAQKPCNQGTDPGVDCNAFADYPCPVPEYFECLEVTQQCEADDPTEPLVCTDPAVPVCRGETLAGCPDYLDCSE